MTQAVKISGGPVHLRRLCLGERVFLCLGLVAGIFLLDKEASAPADTLVVRKVEVAELVPPEPPPASN